MSGLSAKQHPMNRLWWNQIKAVIRLELKKTFFAKRGLWIYLVAALPVALFVAYAIAMASHQHHNTNLGRRGQKAVTYQDLLAVKPGMTREEVITLLGKPPLDVQWTKNRPLGPNATEQIARETFRYSDGQNGLGVELSNGIVESAHLEEAYNPGQDAIMFAGVFQFFFLRLAIFFGCLGIFMNLFRGEVLDKSLHFYFLSPIRRDVLMAGKFLAGLLATCTIFVTSELLQTAAFLWHFNDRAKDLYLYQHHGFEHAAIYVGVTVLACIGYGAFFLVAGMLFRNPIIPAATVLIWESINPFLPAILKQFSVIYYLKSLCPVEIPVSPGTPALFALLISNADPISPPLAIAGILVVALIALFVSSVQVRRMEINYATE
jgi:ABC-type transport system involved in multi-copper enzyme maturation permease subunit